MGKRLWLRLLWVFGLVAFLGVWLARAMPSLWAYPLGLALALLAGTALSWVLLAPSYRALEQLNRGILGYAQRDWGQAIEPEAVGSLGEVWDSFLALGKVLRSEQKVLAQREKLLRTVIDSTPLAMVLLDSRGLILNCNEAARQMFFEGRALEGHNFLAMLGDAPAPFREAVLGNEDALFTVTEEHNEPEIYHFAKRHFELEGEELVLLMVKHMTREFRRKEIDIWKKLIRVISHELNNSLAPISSLVHSARLIVQASQPEPRLKRVFDTIEERAKHLQEFVEGYARFARLPKPRRERVELGPFLSHLHELMPDITLGPQPGKGGYFDRLQIEQVLINLLKNAKESGSTPEQISLEVRLDDTGEMLVTVADRGEGMSEEVLQNALLPFYSTKERGTGLGLALSREIVEAHGGKIRIENRPGGGVLVSFTLPGPQTVPSSAQAKLTLSRL